MQSQIGKNRKIIAIAVISGIGIAFVAFLIVFIVFASRSATSPAESGSATESASNLKSLTNRLDRLESRINSLATETAGLPRPSQTSVRQQRQSIPTALPTNTPSASANSHMPEPTATSIPLPAIASSGPGICGRSPMIQIVLIDRLKISSCQLITAHELFRVIDLPDLQFDSSPQPGDFAGLVNVKELSVEIRRGSDLPSDAFVGLEGLGTLRVELNGKSENDGTERSDGRIEPGVFRGLSSIRTLEL